MKRTIVTIVNALLILLFTYAAFSKLFQYRLFVDQLSLHPWLRPFDNIIAWALPVAELLLVVLLLIPATRFTGLITAAIFLGGFTIYLSLMINAGYHLPCSCGGIIGKLGWKAHIYFNSFFLLLTAIAIASSLPNRHRLRIGTAQLSH